MAWMILRFMLLGPVVGCFAFVALGFLIPTVYESAPVGDSALVAFGEMARISGVASLYALILTYPLAGLPAQVGLERKAWERARLKTYRP